MRRGAWAHGTKHMYTCTYFFCACHLSTPAAKTDFELNGRSSLLGGRDNSPYPTSVCRQRGRAGSEKENGTPVHRFTAQPCREAHTMMARHLIGGSLLERVFTNLDAVFPIRRATVVNMMSGGKAMWSVAPSLSNNHTQIRQRTPHCPGITLLTGGGVYESAKFEIEISDRRLESCGQAESSTTIRVLLPYTLPHEQ